MSFHNQLVSSFINYPSGNAFCIKNNFYSYEKVSNLTNAILQIINQYPDEQRFGVIVSDDIETYAAVIALLMAGKTYIPIHPHHPADRTEQIIEQSGIGYILTKPQEKTFPGVTTLNLIEADLLENITESVTLSQFEPLDENYAYILFTSGSTGIPKGVPITYHNLDAFVSAFYALGYDLNEKDHFLQMFDLTFDLSVMSYLIPLCLGACVYTIPDSGTKFTHVYGVLEEHNITCALMVPSIINYLRPYFAEISLPEMRYSLFCGEALLKDVVGEWQSCVPNAIIENVYGPTEATIFCLTYRFNHPIEDYNGIVTIGKPMMDMESIIVDETSKPVQEGDKGELCLYGPQLTPGYLNADKTREAFFELDGKRYYRTGDIAYQTDNGNFMYCGRVDHQVKIQGFRVELSEVEFHLRNISGMGNVVALAITNPNGLNQIDAVFEEEPANMEAIMTELKIKVPSYMIPSRVHFISPLPLNANGKTDRKALQKTITHQS